jgi:hypothetical protein
MGYSLCNALAAFTRLMPHVLKPFIHQLVINCLDDILFFFLSLEEHLNNIRQISTALRKNKVFIKMVKCF